MPLSRYQTRNEYGLADQHLYKVADKDDPEALLKGVAMAGLVGLLRQLGDLAQFAAEVFHDLHEEVLAIATRGHGLIIRVQQLESEFPLIERTLLTQTTHTSFLYNSGVDWHPNLCMDHNLVTRGDLPRFVMDSYEECRGPPRLFLLDKFDVAGAGACLKHYTDPSFFKTESVSSNGWKSEGQREKKTRRVKKRATCWRNCDTPESFPSSHAKLHQLFQEERLENGGDDLERRVKLKKRQFTGSFLDQAIKTSCMEKFVDMSTLEQNIVTATDGCELGLEIVEIGTVSPLKESIETDKSLHPSPDSRELEIKASMNDFSESKLNEGIESGAVKLPGLNRGSDTCKAPELVESEDCVDMESDSQVSLDDGFSSEIDNYMDAVGTIESEVETDSECRKTSYYSNTKQHMADFYGSEGKGEPQSLFSDSQSVGNSTTTEDGNNSFKESGNSSCSISGNSMAESTTDLEAHVAITRLQASNLYPDHISFDHHYSSRGIPGIVTEDHDKARNGAVEVDDIPRSTQYSGETFTIPCHDGPNTVVLIKDVDSLAESSLPSSELDKEYSSFAYDGFMENRSAYKRTDSVDWSNVEHPLNDENSQLTGVHPETSHDLPNTVDNLVISSRKADPVSSSVEGHDIDLGMPNSDACSGIEQSGSHLPNSDVKYLETMNQITVIPNVDFFVSSARENSEDQYSFPECAENLNIDEQFCETNNPDHAPLFDSAIGALPKSQEDHSIKEILPDPEPEEVASRGSIVGVTETLSAVSDPHQVHVLGLSLSEFGEVAETADSGDLEAATFGIMSFGDQAKVFGPADEADDQCARNNFNVHWGPDSVVESEPDAILHAGNLERVSVPKKITIIHQDRSDLVGTDTNLDDSGTQAIQIDASNELFYSNHGDRNEDFVHDAFPFDMPSKPAMSSKTTLAAEDSSTRYYNVVKVESIEIVARSCREIDAEKDQCVSLTEKCRQSEEQLVPWHNTDLATQNDVDATQDAPVNCDSNMSSNGSSPLISLDGSLTEDVLRCKKLIDGVEAPLISENSTQDMESGSSFLVRIPKYFDNDQCTSTTVYSPTRLSVPNTPLKSADYMPESSSQPLASSTSVHPCYVHSVTSQATLGINPGQLDSPGFPILDMLPAEPSISLEPPPLPPLPPMQWRLGRFQNSPTVAERQILWHALVSVQPMAVPTTNVKAEIVVRSPNTHGHQDYVDGNSVGQDVPTPPMQVAFCSASTENDITGNEEDNCSLSAAQTLSFSQIGNQTLEEPCQPSLSPESESTADPDRSGSCPAIVEDKLNTEIVYENWQPKHIPQVSKQEEVNSDGELPQLVIEYNGWHPHPGFQAPETGSILQTALEEIPISGDGNPNGIVQHKPQRPRNPLIDEVAAIDKSKLRKVERVKPPVESKGDEAEFLLEQLQLRKVGERTKPQVESKPEEIGLPVEQLQLRKVGERVKPEADLKLEESESPRVQLRKAVGRAHSMVGPRTEDRDLLLEQIRNKSFNLRPAVIARPNVQGPRTNLRVAAILQKASNIRQAIAGSDEEDGADNWSDR